MTLFDTFNDLKVCLIIRLLATWYNSQMVYVRWKNLNSDMSHVGLLTGVRQGGVLSPYLFRFYVLDVMQKVTQMKVMLGVP